MVESSNLKIQQRANSINFCPNILCGVTVSIICLVFFSCGSTTDPEPTTNPTFKEVFEQPDHKNDEKDTLGSDQDPVELEFAQKAHQDSQKAYKEAQQAQQAIRDLLQSPQQVQTFSQKAQQSSQKAIQAAQQAMGVAQQARHAVERGLQLIRQAIQSPHQIQQLAQLTQQAVQEAEQAALQGKQAVERAEQSLDEAEQAVDQTEQLARNAKQSARDAKHSARESHLFSKQTRESAQKALKLNTQTEQKSIEVENLAHDSLQLAQQAEDTVRNAVVPEDQMQHTVEQSHQPIRPARGAARQARQKVHEARQAVRRSEQSAVMISKEEKKLYVPDVVGISLKKAQDKLQKRGLTPQVNIVGKKAVLGTVLKQDPKPGNPVAILTPVELTVPLRAEKNIPEKSKVPEVKKKSLTEAIRLLKEHWLSWNVVKISKSKKSNPATVLKQEPAPGVNKKVNTPVNLVVTSSKKFRVQSKISTPTVEGIPLATAKQILMEHDLSWRLNEIPPNKKSGKVLRQSPAYRSLRPADGKVKLVVQN